MPDGSTRFVHPLTTIQYWIIPERRTIPQFDGIYYTLQSPQIYLLAKWQAVKTFDQLRDRPAEGHFDLPEESVDGAIRLYLGHDGESFYMDRAVRDMRGVLADQRVCEIDASEVRGYSLSEALRRLDKKEDRMVEDKWKPIMAERKRMVKSEPEAEEVQHIGGQSPRVIEEQEEESMAIKLEKPANSPPSIFKQEEESEPIELKKPANSPPPTFKLDRHTIPIMYVGNDLPETSGKRKRGHLDQNEEPARRRVFTPKTSKAAPERQKETAQKVTRESSVVAHVPSAPLGSVGRPSSKIKHSIVSTSKIGESIPLIQNTIGAFSSSSPKMEVTPRLPPAVPPSRPLKFAPKRTSRLYKRRVSIPDDNQTAEQEKDHTDI